MQERRDRPPNRIGHKMRPNGYPAWGERSSLPAVTAGAKEVEVDMGDICGGWGTMGVDWIVGRVLRNPCLFYRGLL